MVVTPPNEEVSRRIRDGDFPFTARRICLCDPSHYVPREEAEANARLIAASPELLSALKALRSSCIPGMNWTDDIGRELLGIADAAIARVTGRNESS